MAPPALPRALGLDHDFTGVQVHSPISSQAPNGGRHRSRGQCRIPCRDVSARWAICGLIRRSRRPLLSLVTLVAPSSRAGGRHVKSSRRVRIPRCTWTLRGGLWGRWVGHEHRWRGSGRWGWNSLLWPPCAQPGSVDGVLPPARFRIHVAWQRSSLAVGTVDGLGEATSFERPIPVPVAALPLPACRGGRCPCWVVHISAHSTSPQPAAAVPWREAGRVVDSIDSRADVFKRRERTE